MTKRVPLSTAERRARAEERVRARPPLGGSTPSTEEATRIFHELQVHEIELEMQNEELARAAADLESALARSTALYDFAPVGHYTLTEDGTIRQLNVAGARLLDDVRAGLVGRRFGLHVADRAGFAEALRRVFTSDAIQELEIGLVERATTRTVRHAHLTLARAASGDECHAVAIDVTARRQLEEQLRVALKLDALGRLAGSVAHDFNNLLTVILTHAELALSAAADPTTPLPLVEEDLGVIHDAALRSASLTQQLLAFSRRQPSHPTRVDVNELVHRMNDVLARIVGPAIAIEVVLAPDVGAVTIDPTQLEQVLINLCINAREAMADGGRVTITTERVHERVRLTIADIGVGMDEATLGRLFEPFFTTKGVGTFGFGLSTVHGIVKQAGGDVSISSVRGAGTRVTVELPCAPADVEPAAPAPIAGRSPTEARETILIVDDEPALRKVTARSLSTMGYRVLVAANGREALAICAAHEGPIHLVLTDVVMPQMDGRQFVAAVASQRPDMKVLLMSGNTRDAFGGKTPTHALIAKPFTLGALRDRIRKILDG